MRFLILPCPPETSAETALPTNTAPSLVFSTGRCFPWRSLGIDCGLPRGAYGGSMPVRLLTPSAMAEERAPPGDTPRKQEGPKLSLEAGPSMGRLRVSSRIRLPAGALTRTGAPVR